MTNCLQVALILFSLNYKERHMFMSLEIKATFLIVRTACPYFQNGHFCGNKL